MKPMNSKITCTITVIALSLATALVLPAQTLLNGDFSDVSPFTPNPVPAGGYEQSDPPNHFTGEAGFSGTGGVISDSIYSGLNSPTPYDLFLQPDSNAGATIPASGQAGVDGVYQNLGVLKSHTEYTVTVAESTGGGTSYGQGASTLELDLYNGTNNLTAPVASTPTVFAHPSGSGVFTDESVTFTTGDVVTGDLTLGISAFDTLNQGAGQVFFADATLTSINVPEPSSWALMLLGLGILVLGTRRVAVRRS